MWGRAGTRPHILELLVACVVKVPAGLDVAYAKPLVCKRVAVVGSGESRVPTVLAHALVLLVSMSSGRKSGDGRERRDCN